MVHGGGADHLIVRGLRAHDVDGIQTRRWSEVVVCYAHGDFLYLSSLRMNTALRGRPKGARERDEPER